MLQHLHEDAKADAIVAALKKVLASGHVTPDLGGIGDDHFLCRCDLPRVIIS